MSRNISRRLRRGAGAKCADATPKLKPCFRHARRGRRSPGPRRSKLRSPPWIDVIFSPALPACLSRPPPSPRRRSRNRLPPRPAAPPAASTRTAGVTNANTGAPGLGQAEQQWLQQTMMVGSVALQTSEIALQKAQDEDVKQFAKFEADEQKGLAEVLRSMLEPAGT